MDSAHFAHIAKLRFISKEYSKVSEFRWLRSGETEKIWVPFV